MMKMRNRHNNMSKMVWTVFGIVFALIIIQYGIVAYLGVKAYDEVQDNNGSIGSTIGTMYKDFKEASATE